MTHISEVTIFNMKTFIQTRPNLTQLIVRLIIGGIFIATGWMKIADMGMTIGYFGSMHIPAFLAYVVGYGEFIGGILLVIGLWTEIAAAFLGIVMIVAIFLTLPHGFQMFSMPLVVFAGTMAILGNGAGKFAICKSKNTSQIPPING
jgi:putative oxidoreductase